MARIPWVPAESPGLRLAHGDSGSGPGLAAGPGRGSIQVGIYWLALSDRGSWLCAMSNRDNPRLDGYVVANRPDNFIGPRPAPEARPGGAQVLNSYGETVCLFKVCDVVQVGFPDFVSF